MGVAGGRKGVKLANQQTNSILTSSFCSCETYASYRLKLQNKKSKTKETNSTFMDKALIWSLPVHRSSWNHLFWHGVSLERSLVSQMVI